MTGLLAVLNCRAGHFLSPGPLLGAVAIACALLSPSLAAGQPREIELELQALATEREMLTGELEQFRSTVAILHPGDSPPEQSSNPAVRKLALEMVALKERLIQVTERELALLQEQISIARQLASTPPPGPDDVESRPEGALESKPLRVAARDYTLEEEQENVERLYALLATYYVELQEAARTLPSEEELAQRAAARVDADRLAKIPFSADKVRLSGAEGSTALTQITRRLSDPNIPESRRDIAPICGVRTTLFGSLIASERRSLRPVGKNHYVARIRLQPGDTTLRIMEHRWQLQLPRDFSASDFLITLYTPKGSPPELHLFAVDDLLAEENPHIPAWLPDEVRLTPRAG